jgi:cold shock CspA family protein
VSGARPGGPGATTSGTGGNGSRSHGVVTAFDAREGLGRLTLDDGEEVGFHATQLSDGTRTIEVGRRVVARVVAWHRGQLEATDVTVE